MKKSEIKIGDIVEAKSEEELKHPFQGLVEKIYENSALLTITSYDEEDEGSVIDLNNKLVVNFKSLKKARSAKKAKNSDNSLKVEKI